uniref:YifB family Mg chelatase-like AAA ATPase n=1 Tax=Eubacterium cellulosolvens TaxID=29322 RepID=UPI0005521597|nr:YifB family Mg chelatase-like AAA ATPase [[Eubacterium] cellulosolvens]
MYCSVISAGISGVEAVPVYVEADVSRGMPGFSIVGYVSSQIREARDRIRAALVNMDISLPVNRITVNLAPGDLRKEGTAYDLPIAAAVLMAMGKIRPDALKKTMLLGELRLDGTIGRVNGVLPSVMTAKAIGCKNCILPMENTAEGRVVEGIQVLGIHNLSELIAYTKGEIPPQTVVAEKKIAECYPVDFGEMQGQEMVKRAVLIAAAGFHNILLSGPPGSGKSMAAERIPTILPELTEEERLEISRIHSIVGLLPEGEALVNRRPYRAPHHTITGPALCGGGVSPRPGEVTLAHRGVLFLDELPEMDTGVLEMLREPLENRRITVSRLGGSCVYPASFLLAAAMNPCPCGYYPDRSRCRCSPVEIRRYQNRVSQALLDRMDLYCEVQEATYQEISSGRRDEMDSAKMRRMVSLAGEYQRERYCGTAIRFNSEIPAGEVRKYCVMTEEASRMMEAAFRHLRLSGRGYFHVIKVARTIADLAGEEIISEDRIGEALCFRSPDRNVIERFSPTCV